MIEIIILEIVGKKIATTGVQKYKIRNKQL